MNFSDFGKQVLKIKNLPLPGEPSHYLMEPELRKEWRNAHDPMLLKPKMAAVFALFYPDKDGGTKLLLILRVSYKGVHSNQIGFPGGKVEAQDRDLLHTALRETYEEVGVPPDDVHLLKQLTRLYIPPSNFLVQPFMGMVEQPPIFKIQEDEVASLIEVSLGDFLEDDNRVTQNITASYAENMLVPAFKLNGYVVWGATAMMLNEIKELLKKVL